MFRRVVPVYLIFLLLAAFVYFSGMIYSYPPIWPDEVLFAEPALGLLKGEMSTPSLSGIIPGMDKYTYWMPPVYFFMLAVVFKTFGFGIIQARLLSLLAAVILLWIVYRLAERIGGGRRFFAVLAAAFVAGDTVFLRGSSIARMDMVTLLFIMAGLYSFSIFVSSGNARTGHPNIKFLLIAGVFVGLAGLTHPMGVVGYLIIVIYLLLLKGIPVRQKITWIVWFTVTCGLVFSFWGLYIAKNPTVFWQQFGGQFARKEATQSISTGLRLVNAVRQNVVQYGAHQAAFILFFWFVGLVYSLRLLLKRVTHIGEEQIKIPALSFIVTMVLVLWTNEMWYPLYLVPWLAMIMGHFCTQGVLEQGRMIKTHWLSLAVAVAFAVAVGSNTVVEYAKFRHTVQQQQYYHYIGLGNQLAEVLPNDQKIMLVSIPDYYFHLAKSEKNLWLFEYAPGGIPIDESAYRNRLRDMDFIVYGRSEHGVYPFAGDVVTEFIQEETERIYYQQETETGFYLGVYKVLK